MNGRILPRTLIIAVVATLVGLFLLNSAYSSGVADGMLQAGRAGSGAVVPGGYLPMRGGFGGFGWGFGLIFGVLGFLFHLALVVGLIALISRFVFGRRLGHGWRGPWGNGHPLEEWHRRAHQAEAPVNPATETQ